LVVESAPGETDVAVVELANPSYDEATHTATYDVTVLAEWEKTLAMGFSEAPSDLAALAPAFGAAHLFIDDCPDITIDCMDWNTGATVGTYRAGTCWDSNIKRLCCAPCVYGGTLDEQCKQQFDHCANNRCQHAYSPQALVCPCC
jgi:hypothetical protein